MPAIAEIGEERLVEGLLEFVGFGIGGSGLEVGGRNANAVGGSART